MKTNSETIARFAVLAIFLVGLMGVIRFSPGSYDGFTLHARMPENGGWSKLSIMAEAGVPLSLRLTSDDVVHSFSVGQIDFEPVDIYPGRITPITLTFDNPGFYTFYCTRWCGPNHWRMRGTIEVVGGALEQQPLQSPLYLELGIDIDQHLTAKNIPLVLPSGQAGNGILQNYPFDEFSIYSSQEYLKAKSPEQVWEDLRSEPDLSQISDQGIWDLVAAIWQAQLSPDTNADAKALYRQDCAACHGETGGGDGVFAISGSENSLLHDQPSGHDLEPATNFTDLAHMLAVSPARLQGKIIRGGMGTGMPMWGVIYTEQQTWDLVWYLYSFQFEESR